MPHTVIRAKKMGYCMGVDRAVKMAEEALQQGSLYSLGSLIHNNAELKRLEKLGLTILQDDVLPPKGSVALIRAHGISPALRQQLLNLNVHLIDATCPLVVKNQKIVNTKTNANDFIIIAGKADHPEIKALCGFCQVNYCVVGSVEMAEKLNLSQDKNFLLIAQTTLEPTLFAQIETVIKQKTSRLESLCSICPATQKRQQALIPLTQQCDAIVVVGDRKSANTTGLVHSILLLGKPAFLVEDLVSLPNLKQYNTIGLTAGASAPSWLIEQVEVAILNH